MYVCGCGLVGGSLCVEHRLNGFSLLFQDDAAVDSRICWSINLRAARLVSVPVCCCVAQYEESVFSASCNSVKGETLGVTQVPKVKETFGR